VDWAKTTAHLVKDLDPYDHLVTVHLVISSSTRGVNPGDRVDRPWRIGGFFGEGDAFDVFSQQTGQWGEGVTWDEQLQCWRGDDPDLVASLRADRQFRKPVLNSESGYEYLRDHPRSGPPISDRTNHRKVVQPQKRPIGEPFSVTAGQHLELTAPDEHDWTLLVQQ
jgi:hypothetical protein